MEKRNHSYRQHIRALTLLGLPLIGGNLAGFFIGMTDAMMLGWYSVDSLAAITLAGSFFFVLFIFGAGFSIAVMPMVAEAEAKEDQMRIRRVTRMGIWLSIAYGLCVFPIFWWSGSILVAMGQQADLAALSQSYLRVVYFGLIPALVGNVLRNYLAGLEFTSAALLITLFAAIVNIVVNYILIFGNFGAPEMGMLGAAVASLCVHFISLVGIALYAVWLLPEHEIFARFWRPDHEIMRAVFGLGMPIGFTALSEVSMFALSAIMMGWFGAATLAAHGIAINIAGFTFMLHLGLASAATIRAGNALGRGDFDHLARGAMTAIYMSLAIAACTVTLMVTMPEILISAFLNKSDAEYGAILQIGVTLMLLAALFQFVDGIQAMALGLLRGVMDTSQPMILAAISYLVVGLPLGYFLGVHLGYDGVGVWLGLVAGLATASVLLMWRFWRGKLVELRAAGAGEASTSPDASDSAGAT